LQLLVDAVYQRQLTFDELYPLGEAFAGHIGMTTMGPTIVVGQGHPWGLTLIQGLMESHWAAHYMFPPTVCFDVFSCKSFDAQSALDYLIREFLLTDILQVLNIKRHADVFDGANLVHEGSLR
jgi:S-adenosylmethionine/arginine decarboxylase-like enzyme